jgi:RNA polymerase sigma-70 factor (ECF subfamily)
VNDSPVTQPSLLVRLRDAGDEQAWSQFVDLYGPLIFEFARRRGLQDADAADLTQEVLAAVLPAIRTFEYDPRRGSFRGWLFTVVVNKFRNLRDRLARQPQSSGDTTAQLLLQELPAPADAEEWDRELRQRLYAWAASEVKAAVEDKTWQAFWQTSVLGIRPQQAARDLQLSVAAVYMAKSRVLARLRELIQQAQGDG